MSGVASSPGISLPKALPPALRGGVQTGTWFGALLGALLLATAARADAIDWHKPWTEPQDTAAARGHSDEYAWRLFVALNWPAQPAGRRADALTRLGDDRPTVWESWRNAADVYRQDGADPGTWWGGQADGRPAGQDRFETASLKDLPNARRVVNGVMVPWVDPLTSARRLTEIHMNRAAYDYIRARELYNVDGQLQAIAAGAVRFPYGAKEVKAKWRPISAAERSRYRTLVVTLADGTQRLYGLTALHIASKDLPTWFWATFEHVDNPSIPDSDHWQLASHDEFACRSAPADCDRIPTGIGLEGTVRQFYRLRGTLTGFVDAGGQPRRLANSELETGFQSTASCITCHARSSLARQPGAQDRSAEVLRLPIFDGAERRGFIGAPQPNWFAPGGSALHFTPLDFVWSLAKAQRRLVNSDVGSLR